MHTKVKNQWRSLEEKRISLMYFLSQYDNNVLNKKPQPDAWSALQTMQHLMNAEAQSLRYMKKKLSYGIKLPKAGFKSWLRRKILKVFFAIPLKYKAPKQLETFPDNAKFEDLKTEWASQRLDFQEFIENLPDKLIDSEIWRHQIVGKMTISQMIDFFEDHFDRHQKQIERAIKGN